MLLEDQQELMFLKFLRQGYNNHFCLCLESVSRPFSIFETCLLETLKT